VRTEQTELVESLPEILRGIGFTKLCTKTVLQQFQPVHLQMMDNSLLIPVLPAQFGVHRQITSRQLRKRTNALIT
jgi:hypothetical protein